MPVVIRYKVIALFLNQNTLNCLGEIVFNSHEPHFPPDIIFSDSEADFEPNLEEIPVCIRYECENECLFLEM